MMPRSRGLLAFSAGSLLGIAMLPGRSQLVAVLLVAVSLVITALAAVGSRVKDLDVGDNVFVLISHAAVAAGSMMFIVALRWHIDPSSSVAWAGLIVLSGAIVVAAFASLRDGIGRRANSVFFVLYGLALVWLLLDSAGSRDFVDVTMFQRESATALGNGLNPFAITFADPYGALSDRFYGPGVSVDGILQFGYPYLPLSLLAVAPFEWIVSDFRFAHAVAVVVAAVLMSRLSDHPMARASAVAFLLTAPVTHMVRFGWTEPLVVLAAVVVMYSAAHHDRGTSFLAGALLATKQYAILLLPASFLLLERPWRPRQIVLHVVKAASIVAITTLPFFLWDPESFMRSVVELQFIQPFRSDSLSFPALWAEAFGEPNRLIGAIVPLALVAVVTIAIWIRTPTGAQGFALGAAFTLLVAFAFSKQAFGNYYFLVMGLLFGAAAAQGAAADGASDGAEQEIVSAERAGVVRQ